MYVFLTVRQDQMMSIPVQNSFHHGFATPHQLVLNQDTYNPEMAQQRNEFELEL